MPWYLAIFMPVINAFAKAGLVALEAKYPGLAGIVNFIINLLQGGASASSVQAHLSRFPNGGPDRIVS